MTLQRRDHVAEGRQGGVDVLGFAQAVPLSMRPADALATCEVDQVQLAGGLLMRDEVAGGDVEGEDEVRAGGVLVHVSCER